jgi:16S rRNA (uracil1498-N3)-methyltransferase
LSVVRVLVEGRDLTPGELILPPVEAHHLKVRRVRLGEGVVVLNGRGQEARGLLVARDRVMVEEVRKNLSREPGVRLTLYLGLLKGEKMDLVVQKATELGVEAVIPLVTGRCVPRPRPSRVERWRAIAREALKQCGGTLLPRIEAPMELARVTLEGEGWLLWEGEGHRFLPRDGVEGRVALAVGPEGGWEPQEVDFLVSRGFQPVTLGPRILRAETAAIVGAGLLLWSRAGTG